MMSACSLPSPSVPDGGTGIMTQQCANSADAGAVDAVSTVIATGDVENVITPQACGTNPSGNVIEIKAYLDPSAAFETDVG